MNQPELTSEDIDRAIEMAWENRMPFEAIEAQLGLPEAIKLVRREMKASSWRMWRERVQGRATKHGVKNTVDDARSKSTLQKNTTFNRVSKRW